MKINKSDDDKRLFEEKIKNLKYKNRNRVYIIHEGDYKRKSYPNIHTTPFLVQVLRWVMLDLL